MASTAAAPSTTDGQSNPVAPAVTPSGGVSTGGGSTATAPDSRLLGAGALLLIVAAVLGVATLRPSRRR
jgi:hypothetical protein